MGTTVFLTRVKQILFIIILFFQAAASFGQAIFRTVIPKEPVIAGESFQVQYILEDGGSAESIKPPQFTNFRLVYGPAFYKGSIVTMNGLRPLSNAVYTLQAMKPGTFLIKGATIMIGNELYSSDDVMIEVVTKNEALLSREANSDYFLKPGEDPYRKMKENLFLKVQVDRKTCYVGEPVLATFKLYSRLQSRSDVVKNPGFYGFTVYDLVNLTDRQKTVENIGGKLFDVHTIRKVELFPLQAGKLYIDEMEIRNRVEFSRSIVNKKTEQEIIEGMMGFPEDESLSEGAEIYESEMNTEPLLVNVKPLPSAGKPAAYQGAVGKFSVNASLSDPAIYSRKEGVFIITIRGQGNFMQIDAPRPEWPEGMEVFEPSVSDVLDKTSYPLRGERSFNYPFVVSRVGKFSIPPLKFHFFDPDSGKYHTITTQPASFHVKPDATVINDEGKTVSPENDGARNLLPLLILSGLVLTILLLLVSYRRKKIKDRKKSVIPQSDAIPLAEKLLTPLKNMGADHQEFYTALTGAIWSFFEQKMKLTGTAMNKNSLAAALRLKKIDEDLIRELHQILGTCESGMFTGTSQEPDIELLARTRNVLGRIEDLF